MAIHTLEQFQKIPADLHTMWEFMATPKNLQQLTPPTVHFNILSELPDKMYAGQLIRYIIKPMLNIPFQWCTEITHLEELRYFVDEQKQGPYKLWHHQHHLTEIPGGVLMRDLVHYQAPLGFLGELVTPLILKPKLKEIFDFRYQKLIDIFGPYKEIL